MDQVSKDFVDFLKNLQKPGREIHKQCRTFIVNMSSKKVGSDLTFRVIIICSPLSQTLHTVILLPQELSVDELSECVQDFYQNMADRLMIHFKGWFSYTFSSTALTMNISTVSESSNQVWRHYFSRMWFHNLCSPGSAVSVEQVMDQVEKYIMTRLYKTVFCPETTDDEKKDLATQKRIRWSSSIKSTQMFLLQY